MTVTALAAANPPRPKGFSRERKVLKLAWPADSEFHGLEVFMRPLSMGEYLEVQKTLWSLTDTDKPTTDTFNDATAPYRSFAEHLVRWNLETDHDEEEGITSEPLPPTYDSLMAQEPDLIRAMTDRWLAFFVKVDPTTPAESNSGETSAAAQIPMTPLDS